MGYQTHMMVYGPGGFKFSDFLRVGIPLNIICWIISCLLIPVIFHGLFDFFSTWPAGVIGPGAVMTALMVFWAVRVFRLHGPASLSPEDKVTL
jgi:hypothetical protein